MEGCAGRVREMWVMAGDLSQQDWEWTLLESMSLNEFRRERCNAAVGLVFASIGCCRCRLFAQR
jgi:hypothetical protein